jgi:predicted secreted protein
MAKCMQCGGATKMKKMKMGGPMDIVGMPKYSNDPRTDAGRTLKKGGAVKPKMKMGGSSFGMLSVKAGVDKNPNPTAADRIAGAKMKKAKFGASVKVQHSPAPGRVRSSSGTGTVPVGMRKKKGGSVKK